MYLTQRRCGAQRRVVGSAAAAAAAAAPRLALARPLKQCTVEQFGAWPGRGVACPWR